MKLVQHVVVLGEAVSARLRHTQSCVQKGLDTSLMQVFEVLTELMSECDWRFKRDERTASASFELKEGIAITFSSVTRSDGRHEARILFLTQHGDSFLLYDRDCSFPRRFRTLVGDALIAAHRQQMSPR